MTTAHEDFSRSHDVRDTSNRGFGLVFTGVFIVIGLWPLVTGAPLRLWSLLIAGAVLLITIAAPALLTRPKRLWLRFGLLLHRIVSPVILAFMFYGVVTPTGLLMRLFRIDSLRLRHRAEKSYWIERIPPGPKPDSLSNQF